MTPERAARFEAVLDRRQHDLVVVLENITDPHNVMAILRSCDSVGVQDVYAVSTYEPWGRHFGSRSSSGAMKWVDVHRFESAMDCLHAVREQLGPQGSLWAADTDAGSTHAYDVPLIGPVALVLGNERHGISAPVRAACDGALHLPQHGMAQSLNVSVAAAILLYEAQRQRLAAGLYDAPRLPQASRKTLLAQWEERELWRDHTR